MTVYIDSNIFFYAKIMDKRYGKACAKIISDVAKDEIDGIASVLMLLEVANALRKYGLVGEIKNEIDAIYSLRMKIVPVDDIIIRLASEIYDEVKISPYDCAHVATMRKFGVKEIISADKDFDKISGIKRIEPL
jgi:hypothetical protein